MGMLHELLAAEKSVNAAWKTLYNETLTKFQKPDSFFRGHTKSLKMLEDSPANQLLEKSAKEEKALPTNVYDTLDYALGFFAKAEDLQLQKNLTNAAARANLELNGVVIAENLPVDELLGLESRLNELRTVIMAIPTIDATKNWEWNSNIGCRTTAPEETTKTEKKTEFLVAYEATDKHPAQLKEVSKDSVIGLFTIVRRSGEATAVQKSEAIKLIDSLIGEAKKARMRANQQPVVQSLNVGTILKDLILNTLKNG